MAAGKMQHNILGGVSTTMQPCLPYYSSLSKFNEDCDLPWSPAVVEARPSNFCPGRDGRADRLDGVGMQSGTYHASLLPQGWMVPRVSASRSVQSMSESTRLVSVPGVRTMPLAEPITRTATVRDAQNAWTLSAINSQGD